ncbi:uncharacterized protein LOC142329454 isoform X2 [Lycorma delicatula]|uniref:uncharacterized protein LOC142329454 isoform X2 n=1 Tax=Lycorma delicatula TaxID=130591 RepID=UPI003F511A58
MAERGDVEPIKKEEESTVLSQGKRPDISSPIAHPIPPPRKKRKCFQEISRSEEILCQQEVKTSPLRTSTSLPSVCNPIVINSKGTETKMPMASITEEITINTCSEVQTEFDSLPVSDVYFLKKEESSVTFSDETKKVNTSENYNEYLNTNKQTNDTFLVNDERVPSNTNIEEISMVSNVIKVETENLQKTSDESEELSENLQKDIDKNHKDNKLNLTQDQNETESIKKWQDAMKTKWLQSILIEAEPNTEINHQITINGCTLKNNSSENVENKLLLEKISEVIIEKTQLNDNEKSFSEEHHSNIKNVKNDIVSDDIVPEDITAMSNKHENIPKLIVTPKHLSDTLEKLHSSQTSSQESLYNNRNLIFSSVNLNDSSNNKRDVKSDKDIKTEIRKDNSKNGCNKLDINKEEQLNSTRSSRHSSITDSLQEFETAIYDMLQQSAKDNISDEDDSLIMIHSKNNNTNKNIVNNSKVETAQNC